MADPVTLGIVGAVVGAAGTGLDTFSQYQSSKAQQRAITAQAQAESAKAQREGQIALAKERATGAASGVDISTGTPLLHLLDNARQAEIARLTPLYQADYAKKLLKQQRAWTLLGGMLKLGQQGVSAIGSLGLPASTPTGTGAASGGINLPSGLGPPKADYSGYVGG